MRNVIFVVFFLALGAVAQADLSQLPEKASTDRSEYRTLVLDNGLRVVLLSDPDLNKSAAAMAVGVGSYGDPEERAGLAHFLEHMLFLGTEKYPSEEDYSNYLRSNGGYSNAYTSGDHTNYMFEVNHDALEGALDRFAQFFIAPLFTAEFTEREMNAVDSEFEMNLQADNWRGQQMFRSSVRTDHPENHFSIGNLATLTGIDRAEFMDFYDQHYSANKMALSLTSNASLDQMEAWVREYFAAIENKNRPAIDYSAELLQADRPSGLIRFEPVSDRRVLQLIFPTEGTRAQYRSKPAELVGFLLGYEGAGSLLSALKEQGLATGLSGGAYDATKDYSLFFIDVELTPEGAGRWSEVLQALFAYVELLRESEFPAYVFEEQATVARLAELYSDKGEGANRATVLSRDALYHPLEDAARVQYIWAEPSPDRYFELLGSLRPDNMIAMLEMKGVPTDQEEEHFGVKYSFEPFGAEFVASLQEPPAVAGLSLPAPNPYIPTNVDLLAQRPALIIDEPGLTVYYAQDATFERPQVGYEMRIRIPEKLGQLESVVLRDFYVSVVQEMLNEQLYTALTAGLRATIADPGKGLRISLSGYSEPANSLLDSILPQLTAPELPAERFAALKERKLRQWQNAVFRDAYQQAYELEASYLYENRFSAAEKLEAARDIDFEDVQRFARTLFRQGNLQIVAHGNLSQQDASRAARKTVSALGLKPLPAQSVYDDRLLVIRPGEPVLAANSLIVNNSAYVQAHLLGKTTPENRALAAMLGNFVSEPFFSEMRTRQQLGYAVGSAMIELEDNLYMRFIIQSADYPADELQRRSEAFIATLPEIFDAMPDEQLEAIRNGVRAELEEKDKSIAERAARYYDLAFNKDGDWSRDADTVAALDKLERADLRAMLEVLASPDSPRVTSLSFAEQHAEALESVEPTFTDVEAWKRKQTYQ